MHFCRCPSCIVLIWFARVLFDLYALSQNSQSYLWPWCTDLIWFARVLFDLYVLSQNSQSYLWQWCTDLICSNRYVVLEYNLLQNSHWCLFFFSCTDWIWIFRLNLGLQIIGSGDSFLNPLGADSSSNVSSFCFFLVGLSFSKLWKKHMQS